MKNKILAAAFVLTSIAAFADVPDCTSSLEYIACPNSARWSERQKMPVCDLFFHDGKLWVGGGATELNAGPCPLQYIDPVTKQVTVERNAGTENITVFKEFSDGRLYVPSQDPRDYDSDYDDDGFVFVRNGDNDWTFYKGCAQQQLVDSVSKNTRMGGFVHVWDAEEYDGNIFIGGYGISRTPDFGATWKCATPSWKYGKMALHNVNGVYDFTKKAYKTPTGVTDSSPADGYGTYRRELQFMKFTDRLFAIPYQYVPSDVPTKYYDAAIELHRYDEATGNFYEMTNRTSRVFPELSNDDFNMSLLKDRKTTIPSTHTLKLWHTTPFSNRVFYVVSPYDTYTNCWGSARKGYKETQYPYPMFACAADPSSDGLFTSERLDFGHAEEYPFDFLVKGDRMYALTVRYDSADKLVRHSVWVTTDAHNFTRLFTFKFHQYLISMEYANGYFYFGAGYKGASQSTYQLNSTADCAGNVYRIEMPQEDGSVHEDVNVVDEPRDVTADMVFVCNPAKSRWPGSAQSRHVQDLHPYQGKIYTSGGEWGGNTGPCPCFAVDPYSGAYEDEFDAGTDAIYEFKTFSDGLLYCSAIDIHEGAAHAGHTFRKEADGNWKAYSNCNRGNQSDIKDQGGYYIHNWDMAEYQGKTFVCGYGISGSDTYCTTKMFDATPTLKNSSRKVDGRTWTDPSGGRYNAQYGYSFYRRFTAFLPFDEDLFCIPNQPIMYKDVFTWNEWEPWRWDETANQFVCTTNTWADICPDAVESMANFEDFASGTAMVQLWHPTKFNDRVLYILGGHDYNITPWAAYSAVDVDHKIKATRIDLGSVDIRPFDLYAAEDAVYLVAAEASKTTTTVTNSIWKSADGANFTKLLWFTSTRQASALCYYDGSFYVGMGSNADTKKGWPKMTGTDVSGNIYRIPYANHPDPVEEEEAPDPVDPSSFVKGTPIFYEGFATADYSTLETGKRAGLNNGPNARTSSIGMAEGKWNSMGSNQPSWYSPDNGLALPAAMSAVGFTATGTSVGMNPESQYAQVRGAYHGLADGLLSSSSTGKFVFRVLLNADATALNALTGADTIVESSGSNSPNINYYGAGFVKKPSGNNYGIITSQPNALVFFLKKMKDGSFRAVCRAKGTDGTVTGRDLGAITPGRTYIFYAEVTLRANGDIIRAGYQDVAAYSENLPWQGTMTNEVFSASDYPDCVAIGGGYGTKVGYFRADEFAIGTKLNDVLFSGGSVAVEPTEENRPELGAKGTGAAFNQSAGAFEFSISNVKAGFYYTAYVTDDLAKPFVASDICIRAEADGSLDFSIPTSENSSLFVKVVVSSSPC